jgi:hypothetical protein
LFSQGEGIGTRHETRATVPGSHPHRRLGLASQIESGLDHARKINWSAVLALTFNFGVWMLIVAGLLIATE